MKTMFLEDCCEILDSQRVPITATNRIKGTYPYYGANGIQDYINDYLFDEELVLLAEDGGNFGSKTRPIAYRVSGKCWVNNHAHVIKPKKGLDVDFLCYSLMFYNTDGLVNGATRQKLTQAMMRKMVIPDLSIEKQLEIVNLLNKIVEIKKLRIKEMEKLEDLIKARFVEMFGDPIKMIATGNTELVENLTDEVAVGFVGESTNEYVDNGIPYLRMQNIRPMKVISDNLIYINEKFHKKIRKAHVFTDDVVISRVGINRGMTAVIPPEYNDSSIGNAVIIRKNEKFNSVFLSAYITYVYGQHTSIGYSKGSAQGAISVGLVKKWPIIKANISLQNQFANFVNQVNKSKVAV